MKKIFLTVFIAFAMTSMLYAQSEGASSAQADKSSSEYSALSLGAYAAYQPAIGILADYVSASFGGGVSIEYLLPFSFNSGLAFGVSGHLSGNVNPVKSELLSFMWNVQASAGLFVKIPVSQTGLSIVPELSYGTVLNFPTANPAYENELQAIYVDQLLQFALGVRYNPAFLNGRLEFEAAPVYTLCLEQTDMVHYLGARLGFLIKL